MSMGNSLWVHRPQPNLNLKYQLKNFKNIIYCNENNQEQFDVDEFSIVYVYR